ncbi:MAG: hypothetical protein SWH78_18000 [Thermodesulfobacteriota bacterium]|nr:hypothetical protein [Thermodesulfobacteriota bacterium]
MGLKMGIVSFVAVGFLVFSGLAMASPPVPPPVEGFNIAANVDVEMSAGDCTEVEAFTWTWVYHDPNSMRGPVISTLAYPGMDQYLATFGRAAQVRYTEELASTDTSFFQFKKSFAADSHGVDTADNNLSVEKNYGYVASEASLIANAEDKERVGLSIVANGDGALFDDIPSLCPWVARSRIPATNEFIAAGSDTSTTSLMVADTETGVAATRAPELNQTVSATGMGNATALMKVALMEGGNWYQPDGGNAPVPDLVSKTSYRERSSATGTIDRFVKAMHYHSTIPVFQMPEPWYQLQ